MREAVVRTMSVPMAKDPQTGVRRAVATGMRAGGGGIPGRWVGPDSDGARLALFVGQSVTVVLPEDPGSGAVWEPMEIVPVGAVGVSMDESVAHRDGVELPDGVRGRHCFMVEAREPGEATVTTRLVAPDDTIGRTFRLTVVVRPR